jgi:hypothetical protein
MLETAQKTLELSFHCLAPLLAWAQRLWLRALEALLLQRAPGQALLCLMDLWRQWRVLEAEWDTFIRQQKPSQLERVAAGYFHF